MVGDRESSRKRAAVYVDGAYLRLAQYRAGEKGERFQIDIEKMSDELVGSHSRLRTYFYNTLSSDGRMAKGIERFHAGLKLANRIEVRLCKTQVSPGDEPDHQKQIESFSR